MQHLEHSESLKSRILNISSLQTTGNHEDSATAGIGSSVTRSRYCSRGDRTDAVPSTRRFCQHLASYFNQQRRSRGVHSRGTYAFRVTAFVLYGCETWSLTLRGGRRLRVFETGVLRRIFWLKRDAVTREWRKIHNEELNDLYY